ncbi:hypothetical protein BDA99DRAFT_543936 [Phascolomyces articulosus]|uniref:Uncharacterized protein n=1 Tax=Phascolomyces articulosus TaxID=60185 RepID=A0AAD5P8T2_9FUNG|nr:hypothetical protein BDA99DRAFT_543936 [Phascolomyces articulosus]
MNKSNFHLPSWTGVSGRHLYQHVTIIIPWFQSPHYICNKMLLHITTKYYQILPIVPCDHGCFSPLSDNKQQWDRQIAKFTKRRKSGVSMLMMKENTAILVWSIKMMNVSNCHATHYYQPPGSPIMQIRPLSMTEDCKEYIVLPILLKTDDPYCKSAEPSSTYLKVFDGYAHDYFLLVFKKCNLDDTNITEEGERYKSIGVFLFGNPEDGDFGSDDPDEILKLLFEYNDVDDVLQKSITRSHKDEPSILFGSSASHLSVVVPVNQVTFIS